MMTGRMATVVIVVDCTMTELVVAVAAVVGVVVVGVDYEGKECDDGGYDAFAWDGDVGGAGDDDVQSVVASVDVDDEDEYYFCD